MSYLLCRKEDSRELSAQITRVLVCNKVPVALLEELRGFILAGRLYHRINKRALCLQIAP